MQSLNTQFNELRQSPTIAMGDRVNALKASGQKIIGLQVGDLGHAHTGDASVCEQLRGCVEDALRGRVTEPAPGGANRVRERQRPRAQLDLDPGLLVDLAVGVAAEVVAPLEHRGSEVDVVDVQGAVVADAVNLAARIEGLNKIYGSYVSLTDDGNSLVTVKSNKITSFMVSPVDDLES